MDDNDNDPLITSPGRCSLNYIGGVTQTCTNPCIDHSPLELEITEEAANLGELLVIEATDIDGDSDGTALTYTLDPSSVSCYDCFSQASW